MRQRQVWIASLALSVENFPWTYHITVTLLVTAKVTIVESKKYLCNAVTSFSLNFCGVWFFLLITK